MAAMSSKPFPAHNGLGKHVSTSDMRGLQNRKVMRVSGQLKIVPTSGCELNVSNSKNNSSQDAVADKLQKFRSPLFNLPAQDWTSGLAEKGSIKDVHHVIVPSALKQRDPTPAFEAKALHQEAPNGANRKQVKFTAEKARQLRKELRALETFHDRWYHSPIASRLARPEQ